MSCLYHWKLECYDCQYSMLVVLYMHHWSLHEQWGGRQVWSAEMVPITEKWRQPHLLAWCHQWNVFCISWAHVHWAVCIAQPCRTCPSCPIIPHPAPFYDGKKVRTFNKGKSLLQDPRAKRVFICFQRWCCFKEGSCTRGQESFSCAELPLRGTSAH